MNVLFLSVSTGAGHFKAAEALKEAVESKYPLSRSVIVDSLKYVNPIVEKLVVGGYLTTVKVKPHLYRKLYEISELNDNLYYFSKAVNRLFSSKIKSLISEVSPSVIVCTHPFPLQMLSILKKKNIISTPVAAILTDYVTHSFWVHECIDAYVVAHDYMREEMILRGVPEKSVFSYGIPVSSCFLMKKSRKVLLDELGLSEKTTVLIMGGSLGLGGIEIAFRSLLSLQMDLQIVIITGENIKVKNKLEMYLKNTSKDIRILSYTDRVSDYMEVADLLITKPGGMTISEALVKELPTVVICPIPGQEEGNARFLSKQGAAIRIDTSGGLEYLLRQLLDNNPKIQQMKNASKQLARPNASKDILQLLEQLSERKLTLL